MSDTKYKLYAGEPQTIPETVEYSFVPPGGRYVLAYTQEPLDSTGFVLLDEGKTKMSKREREWLMQSKLEVNVQYLRENGTQYYEWLDENLDALESELRAEKEKTDECNER